MRIVGSRALFVVVASVQAQESETPNAHVPDQWGQRLPAPPSNDLETVKLRIPPVAARLLRRRRAAISVR
jgi:hypothetical protein